MSGINGGTGVSFDHIRMHLREWLSVAVTLSLLAYSPMRLISWCIIVPHWLSALAPSRRLSAFAVCLSVALGIVGLDGTFESAYRWSHVLTLCWVSPLEISFSAYVWACAMSAYVASASSGVFPSSVHLGALALLATHSAAWLLLYGDESKSLRKRVLTASTVVLACLPSLGSLFGVGWYASVSCVLQLGLSLIVLVVSSS